MPQDATFELMAQAQKSEATLSFIVPPTYNIDDMDPRFCMVSLIFTGCYCLRSSKTIDSSRPGMIYMDGVATEPPLIPPLMPMFGQMIGIHVRRYLHEYNRSYEICYRGAYDTEGREIPEFCFKLTTLPRQEPGEVFPEHDALVLETAREGAVLLKNNRNTLPLGKDAWVNGFGAGLVVFRSGCLGAGKINPRYCIGVKEGMEKYSSLKLNEALYSFYEQEQNILPPEELLTEAQNRSDTAVIFISRCSSEAHDALPEPGGYYLTEEERGLLKGVRQRFSRVVAVLNVAHSIETGWIEELAIDAVLLVGLPGMAGGRALAEILEGTVNPSGKLPNTWAKDYWDYPSAKNFLTRKDLDTLYPDKDIRNVTTVYEEGLYVGYRYFDTFQRPAAYLFGHGLSYTTFEKGLETVFREGDTLSLTVLVTNTGHVSGKEVVQLYARIGEGELEQPDKRLVAFGKTCELLPGASQLLTLQIDKNRLKSYSVEQEAWIIEPGEITLLLGGSPCDALPIYTFSIEKTEVVQQAQNQIPCPVSIAELSRHNALATYPTGRLSQGHTEDTLPYTAARGYSPKEGNLYGKAQKAGIKKQVERILFADVVQNPELAEDFIAQMNLYELARLSVGGRTGWGAEDSGFAGMLFREGELEKYGIPPYYFADGNNGLNLFAPNIGFPVSTTVCASWNEELSYREGAAIAKEAKAMGLSCLLAPALNLQRNPLCGRHTEYFSEDPLLAGRMAGQESRGMEAMGVSSCMKHFFGNNAETMRNHNHSLMTERTARELYIGAFEAAFEVHKPDSLMTGYNAANGVYCADDPGLLRGILREELGFEGYVMTDWNGYGNGGLEEVLAAGVSFLAPGSPDDSLVQPIVAAVEAGKLSQEQLEENLVHMIRVIAKYRKPEEV